MEITATTQGKFLFSPAAVLPEDDNGILIFETLTKNDITLCFGREASDVTEDITDEEHRDLSSSYTVVIGGWANTRSVIRRGGVEQVYVSKIDNPRAVVQKSKEWESRWVSIHHGMIAVGNGTLPGMHEIIRFHDADPIVGIRTIGFGCWDSPVRYRIVSIRQYTSINHYSLLGHYSDFQHLPSIFWNVHFVDYSGNHKGSDNNSDNGTVVRHANIAVLAAWTSDAAGMAETLVGRGGSGEVNVGLPPSICGHGGVHIFLLDYTIQLMHAGTASQFLTDEFLPKFLATNSNGNSVEQSQPQQLHDRVAALTDLAVVLAEALHVDVLANLLLAVAAMVQQMLEDDKMFMSALAAFGSDMLSKYHGDSPIQLRQQRQASNPRHQFFHQQSQPQLPQHPHSVPEQQQQHTAGFQHALYPLFLDFTASWVSVHVPRQSFKHIFNSAIFSDLQLRIPSALLSHRGGSSDGSGEAPRCLVLPVHRAILSAWPGPFLAMFSNSYKEARQDVLTTDTLHSPLSMIVLVYYLYTGEFCSSCTATVDETLAFTFCPNADDDGASDRGRTLYFDANTAVEVFQLSDLYCLDGLKLEVAAYFEQHLLTRDNAVALLLLGEHHSCKVLAQKSLQIVAHHFDSLFEAALTICADRKENPSAAAASSSSTSTLLDLDYDLFVEVIKQDHLGVKTEATVLQAIIAWSTLLPERRGRFQALLPHIRFQNLMHTEQEMVEFSIQSLRALWEARLAHILRSHVDAVAGKIGRAEDSNGGRNPSSSGSSNDDDNDNDREHDRGRGKLACRVLWDSSNQGLLYQLGCAFGRRAFRNPASDPTVLVVSSFSVPSRYTSAVHLTSRLHKTINFTSNFFAFFFPSHRLYLHSYTLQHDGTDVNFLRNWVIEGSSNNGQSWQTIHTVTSNFAICAANQTALFHVATQEYKEITAAGFDFVRIRTLDNYPLTLNSVEMYGSLVRK